VTIREVENPLLEVVTHAVLHCMGEVRLREVTHNTGNMSKHVESLVDIAQPEISIGYLGVGTTERSIYVVILPGVLLV
jgi:hypothetical protein